MKIELSRRRLLLGALSGAGAALLSGCDQLTQNDTVRRLAQSDRAADACQPAPAGRHSTGVQRGPIFRRCGACGDGAGVGVFNNLRSMITGRYAIDKEDTPS